MMVFLARILQGFLLWSLWIVIIPFAVLWGFVLSGKAVFAAFHRSLSALADIAIDLRSRILRGWPFLVWLGVVGDKSDKRGDDQ